MRKKTRYPLLAIGPLPPPLDGTGVSFQVFCREARALLRPNELGVVDTSPRRLKEEGHRAGLRDLGQAARVLVSYSRQIRSADRILIFGSNGFLLKMAPILLTLARVLKKPVYIRSFGGSLDKFCAALPRALKTPLIWTMRRADGLIVETELLSRGLEPMIGRRALVAPGYRSMCRPASRPSPTARTSNEIRFCYVGHIREEKGVFTLLESLRLLRASIAQQVRCDLYGPIYESVADRFRDQVDRTPNAKYGGVLEEAQVIPTLSRYDAFVFPSFYAGEGHPGVLIEAMMAGLPMIASDHRAIPEVVNHEVNGLLVRPNDPASLAQAIDRFVCGEELMREMAENSRRMAERYDSAIVVRSILAMVGLDASSETTS